MIDFIENVNENAKVAIGLIISEKMFKLVDINDSGYKIGREALDSCWKWLEGTGIEADYLCDYIDSRDFMDVTEFANKAKDEKEIYAWYTVLYAVSYTTWQAYNKENEDCPPQILDSVEDETLVTLVEGAQKSGFFNIESLNKVKEYLLENYLVSSNLGNKPIIKDYIMKMVDNNY